MCSGAPMYVHRGTVGSSVRGQYVGGPSVRLLTVINNQSLRVEKEKIEEENRACRSSLAESERKMSNWRLAVEKRADDEDEMEKLVVSLNKKVNDLEVVTVVILLNNKLIDLDVVVDVIVLLISKVNDLLLL